MDRVDFEAEELVVAVAVGLAFHRLDLVVRAFQRAGGDPVVVPRSYLRVSRMSQK